MRKLLLSLILLAFAAPSSGQSYQTPVSAGAQATASSSSPTYTAGTMNPLSQNLSGGLRVLQVNPDGSTIDTTLPQTVQASNVGTPTTAQVSVGTTATQLFAAASALHDKGICNTSTAQIVYWGYDANVTTTTGIPIGVGTSTVPNCVKPWSSSSIPTSAIYGIVGTSTATVAVYGQ